MPTVGVFASVFDEQGRVLCVRHGYGDREWGMPGGRIDPGEDPLSAIKREVLEETGIVARMTHLIGIYAAPYKDDLVLLFGADAGERRYWTSNEEISEIGFFALDQIPEPMGANPRLRFQDVARDARGVVRVLSAPGLAVTG